MDVETTARISVRLATSPPHPTAATSRRVGGEKGGMPEPEFLNVYWRLKSRLFEKSCLFKGQRVQQSLSGSHFLWVYFNNYFVWKDNEQILTSLNDWTYIYLYWKYTQNYLETLYSHFQPSCHFKVFKNSGSDCWPAAVASGVRNSN